MNKKNLIIIISILILIIFGLIIYISYLKGIEKGESKDKVKKEKNDILCLGEYKSDSGRFIIYDNGTYTGIFDSHSEEGKYTIKKNKLTFTYEFIGGIAASTFSILGGLLLNVINVQNAFLIVGLIALACMVVTLDYMRTRFGLKPEEYKKEDLEFEVSNK